MHSNATLRLMAHIVNKEARQKYELLETYRAGLELLGVEVKSVRGGNGSLVGSKCVIRGGEIFLVGATIPPFQEKNTDPSFDATRTRRLLLNKKEIEKLYRKTEKTNLTIVPISIYTFGRRLKIDIAIAKKKQGRDKREDVRKKESLRSLRSSL